MSPVTIIVSVAGSTSSTYPANTRATTYGIDASNSLEISWKKLGFNSRCKNEQKEGRQTDERDRRRGKREGQGVDSSLASQDRYLRGLDCSQPYFSKARAVGLLKRYPIRPTAKHLTFLRQNRAVPKRQTPDRLPIMSGFSCSTPRSLQPRPSPPTTKRRERSILHRRDRSVRSPFDDQDIPGQIDP